MSPEVRDVVGLIREALPGDREWEMFTVLRSPGSAIPPDLPEPYAEFLSTVADGLNCGVVDLFSGADVPANQSYADPVEASPVRLGRDEWFCCGRIAGDPVFIRRADGSIWGFPDTGTVWWVSGRFERFAPDLDRFLLDGVFGPGYLALTGDSPDGYWWRLLCAIGRAS